MTEQPLVDDTEKVLQVLESIARQYSESSDEYKCIEIAARAIVFVKSEEVKKSFRTFISQNRLTDAQKQHLKYIGVYEDDI